MQEFYDFSYGCLNNENYVDMLMEISSGFPNKDIVLIFMRILVDEFDTGMLINKEEFDMELFEDILERFKNWAQNSNDVTEFIECVLFLDEVSQKYRLLETKDRWIYNNPDKSQTLLLEDLLKSKINTFNVGFNEYDAEIFLEVLKKGALALHDQGLDLTKLFNNNDIQLLIFNNFDAITNNDIVKKIPSEIYNFRGYYFDFTNQKIVISMFSDNFDFTKIYWMAK